VSRQPGGHDRVIALSQLARRHAGQLRDLNANAAVRQATLLTAAADRQDSSLGTAQRAIAFMDEHARDDISAAEIAAAAYVTPRAVQLAFRRHLGITPMGYLRQIRLEQAHRELLNASPDDTTVTRIAADWQFANLSRFTACYLETYGVVPSHTLHHGPAVQPI
jgi:transcriptional regulator GlxA family with amidase domain